MFKQLQTYIHEAFLHYNYRHSPCYSITCLIFSNKADKLVHKSCLTSSLRLWCQSQHSQYLRSSIKPSEFIQPLSACEWMYGCMWMGRPHTMHRRWEEWLIQSAVQWQGVCSDKEKDCRWVFFTKSEQNSQRVGKRKFKKKERKKM